MANQEISLKWNGYQNNILCNVKELYEDEGLSDVTLVSEGHSFKAHKVILSANSTVFRTIFRQNPHKDPIIVLHDINTASLRTLLTFMYNGEVNVTEEFLPVLLKTAEVLRVCGLSTGSESVSRENEKTTVTETQPLKKRKKSDHEDSNKPKRVALHMQKPDVPAVTNSTDSSKCANIVPKEEPVDSPLTDYSGENTNDTDIALLDDNMEKKFTASPDNFSGKSVCTSGSDHSVKRWISEVSSTQPSLNITSGKTADGCDDDKDSVEIDKEVETVLQSGTIVESLSVATENLNTVPNEVHNCKDKSNVGYANPSFPCPFCPRIYNSWGYRRRHVKSRHMTNRLSCKWCMSILPSTGAWYSHATRAHGIPHEEARNSLVVMVEAHAVLTLNEPSVAQLLGQAGITDSKGLTEDQ